jgi:aminopeptidase N
MPDLDSIRAHWRQRASDNDFSDPNVEEHYPPDLELEPIHLDIDLFVDVAHATASGKVTHTVQARRDGPTVLKLDAVDFEELEARDPDGNGLTWHYDGRALTLEWAAPFSAGEQRRAEIAYRVTEPVAGLYFSRPNEAYPDQPWYAASDHETERARHWLPCLDLPNVRTTLDFHLRAESRFTILANGLLVEEEKHGDGTKTAHWRLEQLCPSYLICIAIGDFVRADDGAFDDGEKRIELAYFCSREHSAEDLLRTFGRTRDMMAWMTAKFDMPFPYPKYYQFALPGIYGAMENISLVSWHDAMVQDETLTQEISFWVDEVNVHEMAHSYFGDAVVCRDFAHAWLKESWATYIDQCWQEDRHGQDEGLYTFYDNAQRYFKEADERYKRPIVTRRFRSSWDMYDAHLYPGGACRLHTLRHELGDAVFWAAVRDYLKRYHGQVVETDDFRRVLEEHSGRALGKFFDQWFRSPGYPALKVTFKYDDKHKQGTFEIEQTQVDKEEGVPAFTLSTDVAWTIDGVEQRAPVRLEEARQVVTVPMEAKPEQVRFDPLAKTLHKLEFNPGDPMLRAQLTGAKDVIGRIQAAHELAKTGKRANIQAIVEAYADEPFWGVREQFARALGEADTEAAVEGLARIVGLEQDPRIMASVFQAAGKYRDARIREAIVARLEQGFQPEQPAGLPYVAAAAAYEALGKQRREAEWDLLVEGAGRDSFNGYAQSGALRGLAETRRAEAIDLLMERVVYGATSNRARPAAVQGLAEIGKGQEKAARERVVEKLVDLLRDSWDRVSRSAAVGLKTVKAPEAIGALQAYGWRLSHQEQVSVERLVKALRAEDMVDGSAVKKQVEELQEKMRKLDEQLQKLQAKVEPAEPESGE